MKIHVIKFNYQAFILQMKFVAIALSLVARILASTPDEAAQIFVYNGEDVHSAEISQLIAPRLFQNGFEKILQVGETGALNDQWTYKVTKSQYSVTKDYCSMMTLGQEFLVHSVNSDPTYKVVHRAKYSNILDSFEERSKVTKENPHVFELTSGTIETRLA